MRKTLLSLFLGFALLAGFATHAGAQSTQLLTYDQLNSLISAGTLSPSGAGGCTTTGSQIVTQTYYKTCVHNNGSCFSGQTTTYVPTYGALLGCATPASTPNPTPTPTPAPTATPSHTTGLSVTDGCIGTTSNWPAVSGDPNTPLFQANSVVTGSTCGTGGHQLYSGDAHQVLNGGSPINAGTVVTVGADLYAQSETATAGVSPCTVQTETANATAKVTLVSASGTVEAQSVLSGSTTPNTWTAQTANFTIATTGVYYIEIVTVSATATANGSFHNVHGVCVPVSNSVTANGLATGMSVSST